MKSLDSNKKMAIGWMLAVALAVIAMVLSQIPRKAQSLPESGANPYRQKLAQLEAEQSRINALPPHEQLEWATVELAKLKSDWSHEGFRAFKDRLDLIPPDAPERTAADALLKDGTSREAAFTQDESKREVKRIREMTIKKAKEDAEASRLTAYKRTAFAEWMENHFLDERMNVTVTASGKDKTVLTIKWALASNVTGRDLQKSGMIETAQRAGFRKVRFTDGFDFGYEWTFP